MTEERVIVKADCNLYFPGVEKFRQALNEATEVDAEGRSPCLMVDLSSLTEIDYSALKVPTKNQRNMDYFDWSFACSDAQVRSSRMPQKRTNGPTFRQCHSQGCQIHCLDATFCWHSIFTQGEAIMFCAKKITMCNNCKSCYYKVEKEDVTDDIHMQEITS